MELGLLILQVLVGAVVAGHGAQKLFGWFGGHGLDGTAGFFESLGLKPGRVHATVAGVAELVGGTLLLVGLLTPLAAALVIGVMVTAIATVHASNGLWNTNGGYELNLFVIAAAIVLAGSGAGEWSLDAALGLELAGAGAAIGALVAGFAGGLGAVAVGRLAAGRERQRPKAGAAV